MNTELIDRIRGEIDELGGDVTYENYKQYVLTQAVICEALRLHPSVPKVCAFQLEKVLGEPH